MENPEEKKEAPQQIHCTWCGKPICDWPVQNDFLTGVFGYCYCSEECMEQHIMSK